MLISFNRCYDYFMYVCNLVKEGARDTTRAGKFISEIELRTTTLADSSYAEGQVVLATMRLNEVSNEKKKSIFFSKSIHIARESAITTHSSAVRSWTAAAAISLPTKRV